MTVEDLGRSKVVSRMTIEELKAEFAKYLADSIDYYSTEEPLTDRKLLQIWLDCAEPREKKILELQKENEQLKQQIDKCLTCGEEMSDLERRATEWIRRQGYNEENLPNDEFVQMKEAYIAGALEQELRFVDCDETLPPWW